MTEKTLIENKIDEYLLLLSDWEKRLYLSNNPTQRALAKHEINKLKTHIQELKDELFKIENINNRDKAVIKNSSSIISYVITITSFFLGLGLLKYWGITLIIFAICLFIIEIKIVKFKLLKSLFLLSIITNIFFLFFYTNYYQALIFFTNNFEKDNLFGKDDITKSTPLIDSQTLLLVISCILVLSCIIAFFKLLKK